MCKSYRMYMAIRYQVWTFISSKAHAQVMPPEFFFQNRKQMENKLMCVFKHEV